jgi:hypothetical protein
MAVVKIEDFAPRQRAVGETGDAARNRRIPEIDSHYEFHDGSLVMKYPQYSALVLEVGKHLAPLLRRVPYTP